MHEPTCGPAPEFVPSTCWLCGRRAGPLGIGKFPSDRNPKADPRFLCEHCVPLAQQLRSTTSFDTYEHNAIQVVIERLGPVVEANGTDLGEWSAEQVEDFVVQVILGFGTAIREQVRDKVVPF